MRFHLLMASLSILAVGCVRPGGRFKGANRDGGHANASSAPTNPECALRCSSDLHRVVDCNDVVVNTCPPDQACSPDGTCVAPCDGAKANRSSIGCDYFSVGPATYGYYEVVTVPPGIPPRTVLHGECFAAYVANTWDTPVTLSVDYNGQSLNVADFARIPSGQGSAITYGPLPNGQLPPGQLAILFLADDSALNPDSIATPCPAGIKAGYTAQAATLPTTGIIHAFHITASAPVVAYDIYPYGGSQSFITSATLLIPTTAWDTNYIAVDAYQAVPAFSQGTNPGLPDSTFPWPFIQIAAAQDGTSVTIEPTTAILGGNGVAPTDKGHPYVYHLNAGEVLQLKQFEELNGSPILADKPIGVWGGHSCMDIETANNFCDAAHQQLPPVQALGHEYVAVRHRDRMMGLDEAPPWRILGAVDGTQLSYEPSPPPGAPSALDKGEIATFRASQPFVVMSQDDQHPFYVSGHMGGQDFDSIDHGTGDPEFVNTVPPEQYLSSYVFMTDPTMANTHLVLARVDLLTNNLANGACDNGRHEIHSDAPFGVTVWGWDSYVSYAFPGGMSVRAINTVVVNPIL
jgi:hypothetical protein